jgi:SAM-dependent methyltransferase
MPWWFHVVESKHELQNPTSVEKIRLLGERMNLGADSRVLDIGSGRGGPAVLLAASFGCHLTCIEQSDAFADAARRRATYAGVEELVELFTADARDFPLEVDHYDAALCLGASFIWGTLPEAVAALAPTVHPDGFLAIGEPYWRTWPLPDGFETEEGWDFLPLPETVARFETGVVEFVTLIASSQDDWDRYESLHWHALEDWLHENANDRDAERFREMGRRYRDAYLRWNRELLGWGIFVGRKR